ncbi:hypothetical protein C662_14361 [Thauera sp. 28]|nr:hypothetical protein C662_14361 [Thauera sp. 28]
MSPGVSTMARPFGIATVLLGAALLLALAAGRVGYRLGAAGTAELRTAHAQALFAAAEGASLALYQAQQRGDALTRELATARETAHQLTQERTRHVQTVTEGRACLGEPALRLLDGAPGLSMHVPQPAGGTAGADAGRVATDADVTGWALGAGAQYAECARRLNALIDWHTKEDPAP